MKHLCYEISLVHITIRPDFFHSFDELLFCFDYFRSFISMASSVMTFLYSFTHSLFKLSLSSDHDIRKGAQGMLPGVHGRARRGQDADCQQRGPRICVRGPWHHGSRGPRRERQPRGRDHAQGQEAHGGAFEEARAPVRPQGHCRAQGSTRLWCQRIVGRQGQSWGERACVFYIVPVDARIHGRIPPNCNPYLFVVLVLDAEGRKRQ